MEKESFKSVDEYMQTLQGLRLIRLEELRQVIRKAAPEAEESISYNMPAFRYLGKILVYMAAFQKHISFFPAGPALIEQFSEDLKDFETSRGTVRLPLEKPVPAALIKRMVQARIFQISEKTKNKKK